MSPDDIALDAEADEGAATLAFSFGEDLVGERLDRLLARLAPDLSRSRLKALILEGAVTVDGLPATDPALRPRAAGRIDLILPPPEPAAPEPEAIPLSIVFEDADLVVIDKPAGMVVHPAAGHERGTLVNALLHHCGDSLSGIGGVRRPGIVHRLDKDTSGLLVVAKNDRAHKALAAQFADHGREGPLERIYAALVWGAPHRLHGVIETGIDRSNAHREKMAVTKGDRGRIAITHYAVEAIYPGEDGSPEVSRIACRLETGRTHQIRVHMAHLGHPLLGDALYGAGFRTKAGRLGAAARAALDALGDRQALHAATLGFAHPATGAAMAFASPLPPDLERLLEALGPPLDTRS
jgi:23S rRNA pseudouridine1911/1915/1917 synthase